MHERIAAVGCLVLLDVLEPLTGVDDHLVVAAVLLGQFGREDVEVAASDELLQRQLERLAAGLVGEREPAVEVLPQQVHRQRVDQRVVDALGLVEFLLQPAAALVLGLEAAGEPLQVTRQGGRRVRLSRLPGRRPACRPVCRSGDRRLDVVGRLPGRDDAGQRQPEQPAHRVRIVERGAEQQPRPAVRNRIEQLAADLGRLPPAGAAIDKQHIDRRRGGLTRREHTVAEADLGQAAAPTAGLGGDDGDLRHRSAPAIAAGGRNPVERPTPSVRHGCGRPTSDRRRSARFA